MTYVSIPAESDAAVLFAADRISGVDFSRVKAAFGVEGAAVDVSASNPLPVVQTGIATAAGQALSLAELQAIVAALAAPLTASGTFTEGPSSSVKYAKIDTASSGQTALVAAVTGKKIRVIGFHLIAGGSVNVKLQSGSTDLTGAYPLVANSGLAPNGGGFGICETAAAAALNINLSAAVQVSGALAYLEI